MSAYKELHKCRQWKALDSVKLLYYLANIRSEDQEYTLPSILGDI